MDLSMIGLWQSTGALARVVVVLLGAMSVAATAVAIEKWRRLRAAELASASFVAAWRGAGSADPGSELAARFPASPVAALVAAVASATAAAPREARSEIHDRVVRRSVLTAGSELRRGLATIATVGSTAPFVGLFGTVVGIVNAFHELGARNRGGVATISSGIAEALVTTAIGIMVAIPAVWIFNALSQRIGRLLVTMEAIGEEVAVAALARDGGSDPMSSATAGEHR